MSGGVNYLWAREHLEALALVQDAQEELQRIGAARAACISCGLSDHMPRTGNLCLYCDELDQVRAEAFTTRLCAHARGRVVLYYALACALWVMMAADLAAGALILAGGRP